MPRISIGRIAAIVLLAAAFAGLRAEPALAGTYVASVCDPSTGSGFAEARFERNSAHYESHSACGIGGDGLTVTHQADRSSAGAWGGWSVHAPPGTSMVRVGASAVGRRRAGHTPELLVGPIAAPLARLATPNLGLRRVRWSGPAARAFTARLRCRPSSGCARGRTALVRVKAIRVKLVDRAEPSLGLGGSLLDRGSRRGSEGIEVNGSDPGGGLRWFLVQVNGEPLTARQMSCRIQDGIATRLRPCPGEASSTIGVDTTASPFRQGPNLVRLCAADYATRGASNRRCADRWVRTDNLCPISSLAGARLVAHLPGGRSRLTLGQGRRVSVSGRVLSAGGSGLAGAQICVAATRRGGGTAERIVATPKTGSDGRFSTTIPGGPSRRIRVAHWPNDSAAIERYLDLLVRAAPRLRLRPRGPIRNGDSARFEVTLPRPARAHRRVRIQARSGKRWLDIRTGSTGSRGRYRARYRFHATTSRSTYAFRALVPRQPHYPYEAGASKRRRVTVVP